MPDAKFSLKEEYFLANNCYNSVALSAEIRQKSAVCPFTDIIYDQRIHRISSYEAIRI